MLHATLKMENLQLLDVAPGAGPMVTFGSEPVENLELWSR